MNSKNGKGNILLTEELEKRVVNFGVCKYCGQEKKLIGSHIIPKCLLKPSEVGSYVAVNPKEQKLDKNPMFQNGWKESLLCQACDNELGKLDGYGAKIL